MKRLLMMACVCFGCALNAFGQATDYDATYNGTGNLVIRFKSAATKTALLDDFAEYHNYQASIPNPDPVARLTTPTIPNPETKADFFARKLEEQISEVVQSVRVKVVAEAAAQAERERQKDKLPRTRNP